MLPAFSVQFMVFLLLPLKANERASLFTRVQLGVVLCAALRCGAAQCESSNHSLRVATSLAVTH